MLTKFYKLIILFKNLTVTILNSHFTLNFNQFNRYIYRLSIKI